MPPSAFPPALVVFPWAETAVILAGFVWGAILGSFLNVVVHRVPRGDSAVRGRSRCPRCGAAIRPRDNLPVLGWILLRGRCRDCRGPIPVRYPLVEAGCGLLLAATAGLDLVPDVDRMLVHGAWLPVTRFVCHAAALLTAVAWWMLAMEGAHVTRLTVAIAVAAVGAGFVALPGLQPLGLLPDGSPWPAGEPRWAAFLAWLAGMSAGLVAAALTPAVAHAPLILLAAVGGWQTVAAVLVVTTVARTARRSFRGRTSPLLDECRKSPQKDGMIWPSER